MKSNSKNELVKIIDYKLDVLLDGIYFLEYVFDKWK